MMNGFKLLINFITNIIKTLFKWEIMPNISLGMFICFFFALGIIFYVLFYVILNRGGK